jgi:pimeloyl-ACP methyl ester carboxylesterase
MGDVDYRVVGSGRPLVLVTGLGASIDDWAPIFVNALATHFRVYVFDNAGVGQTAALPSPLTIQEMANQTSTFLTALHIGRCAVLGWSMGGMIAQALAIEHPHQVTKLILAATQAGTGKAIPPSAAFQAEASSTNPLVVLNILFPKSQALALQTYVGGVLRYPDRYSASVSVKAEQNTAIDQWFAGDDAIAHRISNIRIPTLIADGTQDVLDPTSNARQLSHLIHTSTLVLYPDAGHGFLFQDEVPFSRRIESFVG